MRIKEFRGFLTIWVGKFTSLFSSGMTSFALSIWIYQRTQSPTALTLSAFFATFPMLFFRATISTLPHSVNEPGLGVD